MQSLSNDPDDASANERHDLQASDLESIRMPLIAFVFSLIPNAQACEEVVQDTLMFLWERRAEKRADSNIKAWAFKVARFKVMAWRRDRAREPFVKFSEDVLLDIAAEAEMISDEHEIRMNALANCLNKLGVEDRALLRVRYTHGVSLTELSLSRGESPNRLHKRISRLRAALRQCVEKQLYRNP